MLKKYTTILMATLVMSAGVAPRARASSDQSIEVLIEWNQLLQTTIPANAGLQSPRFYAMLHVAMFDAINSIERAYSPYHVRVQSSHGASTEAAAAQAAHDVLTALIGTRT